MSDLIDRQQAIDDILTVSPLARLDREWVDRWLRQLPSANTSEIPNSSDTISRTKAIDAVKRLSLGETDAMRLAMRIGDYLERLSPAQPKKGKWIYHIDDLFPAESTMECNQCHAEQPLTCDDEFCPHCGAKMEGEHDG